MRGRIIVQQAPGLGRMQIRPHVRDPFQQLVEHTFVEVRVHHLPRKNELTMDHAAQIKKSLAQEVRQKSDISEHRSKG